MKSIFSNIVYIQNKCITLFSEFNRFWIDVIFVIFQIYNIVIHIGLLAAKIKSCIPSACDKDGNNIIITRAIICDLNIWLYACAHSVCKQAKWQPAFTHDRKIVRWHTKPYMNNDIGLLRGYKNILPSVLTILLVSKAIYSYFPLKAIQCYININGRLLYY